MNENNKVLVRVTGFFEYENIVDGLKRAHFPGDDFVLNLNLDGDRKQLANILSRDYDYKGFLLIEQSEFKKIEAMGYSQEINNLSKIVSSPKKEASKVEQKKIEKIETESPRLKYEGVTEEVKFEQEEEVVEPIIEEVEEQVEEKEPEVKESVKSSFQDKKVLDSVHYRKLQKVASDNEDLEYETKDQFIEVLLELDPERFNEIYDAYLKG